MNFIKKVLAVATTLALTANSASSSSSSSSSSFNTEEKHLQKRIIGGSDVQPSNKYPFMMRVAKSNTHRCGGSLIDPYWVLSAAHCLVGLLGNEIKIEYMRYNLSSSAIDEGAQVLDVEHIDVHPQFDDFEDKYLIYMKNDVALIKLKNPIFSTTPINLERDLTHSSTGYPMTVIGWGRTVEGAAYPVSILQEVNVPVVDNNLCKQAYPGIDTEASNICAGYDDGVLDACNGDSGGPLFTQDPNNGKLYQVGIVSNGRGCARPFSYGTYTRITYLLNYIDQIMSTYTNPCANNPCNNGGICSGFDNTGGLGKRYQCLCPVDFIGEHCETPVCSTSSCSMLSSSIVNTQIQQGETKTLTLTATHFPTNFGSHSIRILTSIMDRYGQYEAIVTAPNGKEIVLEFYDTRLVGTLFDCYQRTSWDFNAKSNFTSCPASHLRPKYPVNFNGDDLNGQWTLTISNTSPVLPGLFQIINVVSWAIQVDSIQPCSNNVCQNGGTCLEEFGIQRCVCPYGSLGDFCEKTPCSPNPCSNGICYIEGLSPRCDCDLGFAGRYCDKLSCPQGCLFGQCQPGGICLCSSGWTGPSCSLPDVGNSGEALCFDNNEQVYDGTPIPSGINPVETATSVSKSRNCAIETVSGGKSIIDVGYVVSDGFNDYCCRGKSKVGFTSPLGDLTCITRDCEGTPLQAGLGSASFSLNPNTYGSDCYHSCVDSTLSSNSCASSPLFKGSLVTVNNKKRAPGDSLYIATQPSSRKDCFINNGQSLSSGFTVKLDDGTTYCCSKGTYQLEDESCNHGCFSVSLPGRPFVMENSITGDACYANCVSIQ